jgi:RES domain-containing protein
LIVTSRLARPAYAAFDGVGGLYRAGRWHALGHRVIYVSESEALATLEVLVHLSSFPQMPEYICLKAHIPEELVLDVQDLGILPDDWRAAEPVGARALGTRWIREQQSAALRVPSVVIPRERNYLLNPEHPDFRQILVEGPLAFEFDVRLETRLQ